MGFLLQTSQIYGYALMYDFVLMHTHTHGDFSHNMNTHPLELVFTVIIFLRQSALVGMESWAHCVAS